MAASTDDVVVAYAVQVDKDTAASGAYTALKKQSGGFTADVAEVGGGSTSGQRLADAPRRGRKTISGTFEFEFGETIFDDLLASALAGTWTSTGGGEDKLEIGTSNTYLSIAVFRPYLESTRQYRLYTGCQVSSVSFSFPQDGIIGMSMGLSAANESKPATAPWASLVQPAATEGLRTCDALTSLKIQDTEVGSIVPSVSLELQNDTRELFDVRQCDPAEIILGSATLQGTIEAYHDDESDQWEVDADTGTLYSVEIDVQGSTKLYRFVVPSATNRAPGADDSGDDVTVTLPFGAVNGAELPAIYREQ